MRQGLFEHSNFHCASFLDKQSCKIRNYEILKQVCVEMPKQVRHDISHKLNNLFALLVVAIATSSIEILFISATHCAISGIFAGVLG